MLKIEYLCLKQFYYFSRRHRRYFIIFLSMYISSLFRWRKLRLLRAGYCFIQLLDDILDGDRHIHLDPRVFANEIADEIRHESFSKSTDASILCDFVISTAKARSDYLSIKQWLLSLVNVLVNDYDRRINRRSDLASVLSQHHKQTFQLSMDITLAFLDSKVRSFDCPEIIESLVWCSVMRDLRDDLTMGIINIPKDVFEVPNTLLSADEIGVIISSKAAQAWMRAEFDMQTANMKAIGPKLPYMKDNIGRQIIKIFWKSIKSYVPKYEKQHRAILSSR